MAFRNRIVRISQLVADRLVGAYIATAESGARWVLSGGSGGLDPNKIQSYSGDSHETDPATIYTFANGVGGGSLVLESPTFDGSHAPARISLNNNGPGGLDVLTIDSAMLLGNGSFLNGIEIGDVSLTFNATGDVAMNHGLGVAPIVALADHIAGAGGPNITIFPRATTNTSVTWHARTEAGGPYVGALSSVRYLLIA